MKNKIKYSIINSLLLLMVIITIGQLSSCGNDDPTAQEIILAKLIGTTWKMQGVLVDGKDKTSVYEGLTITISEGSYVSTNGGPIWPATGTWSFASEDGTKVVRDDDTEVIVAVTETTLKLTLEWETTTIGSGRSHSVAGKHVFTFSE